MVWGAGRRTRHRVQCLLDRGLRVSSWIDIDPKKIGNVVWGAPIRAPEWLEQFDAASRPFVLSYVANHGAAELIADHLGQMGYVLGEDYLPVG